MKTKDFDYHLPQRLIAQTPVEPRDSSRLMVLNRKDKSIEHHFFPDILNYLDSGDTLVFNDSRVIPARIHGTTSASNSKVELLLLRRIEPCVWETLVKPGKKITPGSTIILKTNGSAAQTIAEVLESRGNGIRKIRFSDESLLEKIGQVPLPPYIHSPLTEPERYQTIYSHAKGSVAAPTAGLHFTAGLLNKLQQKGINCTFVTLHIGLDTFRPIHVDDPQHHPIHTEFGELSKETSNIINKTRKANKRVIAVGTSTVRLIESASQSGVTHPFSGYVNLFIMPGYHFCTTNTMLTNFHLPKSTLLLLVSAFASKDFILQAYNEAINKEYRFYSFGDAMLIL
jgi:S-adenosylmethionine:tRNA ribosyltransferase-isomerase